jgi:hypothetical protein
MDSEQMLFMHQFTRYYLVLTIVIRVIRMKENLGMDSTTKSVGACFVIWQKYCAELVNGCALFFVLKTE